MVGLLYAMPVSYICQADFQMFRLHVHLEKEGWVGDIKCLFTELGQARRENIWLLVIQHGGHDLEPNIFPSGPPTQPIST